VEIPPVPAKAENIPAVVAAPKVRAAGEVYETTGELQWEQGPAPGAAYETTGELEWDADPAATKIREAILACCGRDLREVRVEFLRDGRLHITLRVTPGADRGRVENAVRQIPDVVSHGRNRGYFMD
jgi:hypothetical protein